MNESKGSVGYAAEDSGGWNTNVTVLIKHCASAVTSGDGGSGFNCASRMSHLALLVYSEKCDTVGVTDSPTMPG